MANTNARMGNHDGRTICGNQINDPTELEEWLPIPRNENLLLPSPNVQVLNYFMGESASSNLTLIMSNDDNPKSSTPDTPEYFPMTDD
ncbi:brevican core protein-like protein [Corchorus olitorius]|uniref:Brevican core protein-like protein n=1 Tax=Corchorus olitorius TaxID=93759 RepID=A0A1R3IT33_9ROSI|nr:brevican core protein-like protein [Corchorus olitorius]